MKNNPQWMLVLDDDGKRTPFAGVNFANRPGPPLPRPGHPIRINGGFFFVSSITPLTADYQRLEVVVMKTNRDDFAELAGLKSKPRPPRRKRFRG
jgi:hypothetical protein